MASVVGLPTVSVCTGWDGMLDPADLRDVIRTYRHRSLVDVATIGPTSCVRCPLRFRRRPVPR